MHLPSTISFHVARIIHLDFVLRVASDFCMWWSDHPHPESRPSIARFMLSHSNRYSQSFRQTSTEPTTCTLLQNVRADFTSHLTPLLVLSTPATALRTHFYIQPQTDSSTNTASEVFYSRFPDIGTALAESLVSNTEYRDCCQLVQLGLLSPYRQLSYLFLAKQSSI